MNDTTVPAKLSYAQVAIDGAQQGGNLAPRTLGEVVAFSEVMARAGAAIPSHLRGETGACLAVTMLALGWEMNPFMVAAKSYKVGDTIAYEAQLIAAVINTRAPIVGRLTYEYAGEGQARTCTVKGEFRDGTIQSYTSPPISQINPKNSPLWKSDPDQQLAYYSSRSWGRRYSPEVILGVYDPEEAAQFRNITPREPVALHAGFDDPNAQVVEVVTDAVVEEPEPTIEEKLKAQLVAGAVAKQRATRKKAEPKPAPEVSGEVVDPETGEVTETTGESGATTAADPGTTTESGPAPDTSDSSPAGSAGPGDLFDDEPEPEPEVDPEAEKHAKVIERHRAAVSAGTTYDAVRGAVVEAKRDPEFKALPPSLQSTLQVRAYERIQQLRVKDQTVPGITDTAWRFMNWLAAGAPGGDIEKAYETFQENAASGLSTEQHHAIEIAVKAAMEAQGDDA